MAKVEKKIMNKFLSLFMILAIISSGLAIYEIYLFQGIETVIRYIIIGFLALYDIRLFFHTRKLMKSSKRGKRILYLLWIILYGCICFGIAYSLGFIYNKISSTNKSQVTYTSYLVVMANNPNDDIKTIKDSKIALLKDEKNPDGHIIPLEMIEKYKLQDNNEIIDYDDYGSMLADMYANEIDAVFIPSGYEKMFSTITGYETIKTDTKIIGEASKVMKKAKVSKIETASTGKSITQPFTILLMGVDTEWEVLDKNEIAHGDTLILVTFNPKTLNATMLSFPRDSYVPISCWSGRPENKITHAAMYGNDCMMNTIQDYFDTHIDYYVKINFKGLVKLVDALGGVYVDVPQRLCTDDSNRGGEYCIDAGYQLLNGEGALVYARDRKDLEDGDFGRARHQRELIMLLINKMKEVKDVTTFMNILNTVSNSMDTNLTTKQILSFYNVGKDIMKRSLSSDQADLVNIQQLYLQGIGQMIYDERAKMVLWDYVPNKSSRDDIIQAMNENLEKTGHNTITEFHFSINNPYEKSIIGEGPYSRTFAYNLLPDFEGDTQAQAQATCDNMGIKVTFKGTGGTVIAQSEPFRKRIDLMKEPLVLTLSKGANVDDDKEKDKDNEKEKEKE
ncbi:MAG: LCP family protein, partial [Bacilli bacterium]|nr:LCP family protein [Bacilli bacterium]